MQFAKDSFFLALQQRLASLNPARTVTVSGTTLPAIVVTENLPPSAAEEFPNTFYIEWGEAEVIEGHAGGAPLMSLTVLISYYTMGSVASMVDRGRLLSQLDRELLSICQPPNTDKRDYTRAPGAALGSHVFWGQPSFVQGVRSSEGKHQDSRAERKAQLTMYFFPEVILV